MRGYFGVKLKAIGSLLPKLSELLNQYNLGKSIRSDVDCVIHEQRVMRVDLCNVSEVQRDNNNEQIKLVKLWADEVRELSYDIEDVVDGFLIHVKGSEPATSTRELMELIQKIGGAIKDIKNQVQHKSGWKGKYKVEEVVANTVSSSTINAHHLSAMVKDRELFGIDNAMSDLTKRLRGAAGKELKVLSIFGSGGLGKTTLARAVYNQLKGSFHFTVFVPVGRNPNVKKLLYDIFFELDKPRYINLKAADLDERQLTLELTGLLKNNRYLIVIDDLWDKKVWHDLIKFAFVDDKCGSKVIITTRIFEVAAIATDVYKLYPLSYRYSEELFYATLSPEEGRCEYDVTDEVIEKILSKCGGVPLAIITVASLLASKQREDWPKVYNSLGFGFEVNEDTDNTRKILLFSYSDLPRHLRTCLLHLSIFPEDKLIDKDMAIWMWVAEGFVHEEPGKVLFEVGERFFNQLVSRSMIQVVGHAHEFLRTSFRIHDLVLDMIRSLSKDENFVTVLEIGEQYTSSKNSARRLAVQEGGNIQLLDHRTTNCVAQLRSFYAIDCYIAGVPSISSFKVLRALYMGTLIKDQADQLEHIGKLLQLRYLGLEGMPIRKLPKEIGDLLFLQTLILNGSDIEELPHSVGLRQLKCLRAVNCGLLQVPDWMVNMTSLEDLSLVEVNIPPVFAEGLSNMKGLRDLEIGVYCSLDYSWAWARALVKSIGNLLKLQSLRIRFLEVSGEDVWEGFVPPRHLHTIIMQVMFSRLPPWLDSTHLPSLSYLELGLINMEGRCLEILGRFPELHTLVLRGHVDHTRGLCFFAVTAVSGAFPQLRHFICSTMPRFQPGVMPRLEYLELMVDLLRLPDLECDFTSLGNLPLLHKVRVELVYYRRDAAHVEYAKRMVAALRHALDMHPHRRPVLQLVRLLR